MAITGVLTPWLQYRGRFVAPACANALCNGVVLLALMAVKANMMLLAAGFLVASMLRMAAHGIAYRNTRPPPYRWGRAARWELDAHFCKHYAYALVTGLCLMTPLYAPSGILIATDGGLARFNYAFKLVLLPIVLCQTLIQTVLLPFFARTHYEGSSQRYAPSLCLGYIGSLAVALATAIGSHAIITLCFGHGTMEATDITAISSLLRIGIWAMPAAVLSCLLQHILYAAHHTQAAMRASILNTLLLLPAYRVGHTIGGLEGVMAAYVCMGTLYAAQMAWCGTHHRAWMLRVPYASVGVSTSAMVVVASACWAGYSRCCAHLSTLAQCGIAVTIGMVLLGVGLWPNRSLLYHSTTKS
jgi:peptidoglycan biosynthesis protein MviN/MurJ (putative lipid II flippase)